MLGLEGDELRKRKILIVLLLITNGYFIFQLIQAMNYAQINAWPLSQDVGWQWARIIIPGMMLVSSLVIICIYYFVLFVLAKFKGNKNAQA